MRRVAGTAALAGLAEGAEISEDLHEVGYGSYEGRTTPRSAWSPGRDLWRRHAPASRCEAAGARADRAIARVLEAEGDVALVGHGRSCAARRPLIAPARRRLAGPARPRCATSASSAGAGVIWRWNDRAS